MNDPNHFPSPPPQQRIPDDSRGCVHGLGCGLYTLALIATNVAVWGGAFYLVLWGFQACAVRYGGAGQ